MLQGFPRENYEGLCLLKVDILGGAQAISTLHRKASAFLITAYNKQLETLLTGHEYMSIEERLLMNTNITVHFNTKKCPSKSGQTLIIVTVI